MNREQFVILALAALLVYDTNLHARLRKIQRASAEIVKLNDELLELNKRQSAQKNYLIHLLDEHGVPFDEFDWIALYSLYDDPEE